MQAVQICVFGLALCVRGGGVEGGRGWLPALGAGLRGLQDMEVKDVGRKNLRGLQDTEVKGCRTWRLHGRRGLQDMEVEDVGRLVAWEGANKDRSACGRGCRLSLRGGDSSAWGLGAEG
jgi:hypothetical protein